LADQRPTQEFGKRRGLASLPPEPRPKRSGHVALLVMGTLAVGGGAYALIPSESCTPPPPAMAAPALPQSNDACPARRSSGSSGSGGRWSSFHLYGGPNSSEGLSSASAAESSRVARGGFGSFAHAFGFSGGG